jgi:hypothetical protein
MRVAVKYLSRLRLWSVTALEGRWQGRVCGVATQVTLRDATLSANGLTARGTLDGADFDSVSSGHPLQYYHWTSADRTYAKHAMRVGKPMVRGEVAPMVFLGRSWGVPVRLAFDPAVTMTAEESRKATV